MFIIFIIQIISSSPCLQYLCNTTVQIFDKSITSSHNVVADSFILDNLEGPKSPKEVTEPDTSPVRILGTEKKHSLPGFCSKSSVAHSYLFGSDFVSVDALGNVLIAPPPALFFQELLHSKCISANGTLLRNHWKEDSSHLKTFDKNYDELGMEAKTVAEQPTSQATCIKNVSLQISSPNFEAQQEKAVEGDMADETFEVEIKEPSLQADKYSNYLIDSELSPRLTNLIKTGVVPESPINDRGLLAPRTNIILYSEVKVYYTLPTNSC